MALTHRLALPLLLALAGPALSEDPKPPAEVQRVLDHVLQEAYPEVYDGKQYRLQILGWAVGDVDGDGATEVFLLISPHYQQTAPIQIYRLRPGAKVQHLRERLAPGPLIRTDGTRLDAHTLRLAIDLTIQNKGPDFVREAAMKFSEKASVVVYREYLHADEPENDPQGFLDLTEREEFAGADECEGIQFSQPDALAVGTVAGAEGVRLVVLVGKEVYAYRITKISPEGFLEKKVARIARPEGVVRVDRRPDGSLAFLKADGAEVRVELPAL